VWFLADSIATFDIGSNLTAVIIALIAAIPAIVAAFYARKAGQSSSATGIKVDGSLTHLIQAKDDLISAANTATAYAQGQNAGPNGSPNPPTAPKG
jgi:hypothetical protein